MRLLTVLLGISLIGSMPTRAEWCEPATAPCHNARPQAMDCCRPLHCHCDMSGTSRPASNPAPQRATTVSGREIVKIASMPVATMFFATNGDAHSFTTHRAYSSPSASSSSYLLTHAFLI